MENPEQDRETLTPSKFRYALKLCFSPRLTRVFMHLKQFEDLDVNALINAEIHALVLDIDGTLVSHGGKFPSEPIKAKLRELQNHGIKLCFFSNKTTVREGFEGLGISFIRNVPAKPNPKGFLTAIDQYLDTDTKHTAVVGDNCLADGGGLFAGLCFIHVEPIPGHENLVHKITRNIGYRIFRVHGWMRKHL